MNLGEFFNQLGKHFINFNGWIKAIEKYWKLSEVTSLSNFWMYIIGTPIFIWLITRLLLQFFYKYQINTSRQRSRIAFKRTFYIHKASFIASLLVATVWIGVICFFWSTNRFDKSPLQFPFLLSLLIAFLFAFRNLFSLASKYRQKRIKEIVPLPLSTKHQARNTNIATSAFRRLRYWLLILLLGLVGLFWVGKQSRSLVALVVDNSTSMEKYLETTRNVFSRLVAKFDKSTDIVITTLARDQDWIQKKPANLKALMQRKQNELAGEIAPYIGKVSKTAPAAYLSQLQLTEGGSPVLQAVWKNHLFSKAQALNVNYKKKYLVVITDGGDASIKGDLANEESLFCDNEEFVNFFPLETTHFVLYLNEQKQTDIEAFKTKVDECGYQVYEGDDVQSYQLNLENVLNDFTSRDMYVLVWMFLIVIVLGFFIIIQPTKKT